MGVFWRGREYRFLLVFILRFSIFIICFVCVVGVFIGFSFAVVYFVYICLVFVFRYRG